MRLTQLQRTGGALETLAGVNAELRRSHDVQAGQLERSVRSLEAPKAQKLLIEKRNATYARMHGLLHTLWAAPESGTLRPYYAEGNGDIRRPIQLFGHAGLALITDSRMAGDPEAEHSYGLIYPFDVAPVQPLQGLGNGESLVYSGSGIELRIEQDLGDPRARRNPVDAAASFLGNVETLERICEEAGVEVLAPAA